MKFSLWLLFDEKTKRALQAHIDAISKEHGTPRFVPHITLLGSVETTEEDILRRTRTLLGKLKQYAIHFTTLEHSEKYHQHITLRIDQRSLQHARAIAVLAYNDLPYNKEFLPHCSIAYGTMPEEEREEIVTALSPKMPKRAVATRFMLVDTTGPSDEWRVIIDEKLSE